MSSNGAGPSRGMSAHPKLWKPLGGRGAFPAPLNTTTGSVRTAFPGPASGSTLADTAIARLLPGIRSVNSFVRDILSAEDSAPDKERGRRGRAGSRSTAARRSSLGVRAHASAEADLLTPTSASTSTLAEGDGNLYDSFRSSFPHLMSLAEQGGPLSRGTLDRRSKSLPRRTSAAATPVSRYGEDEENVALSDETRAKVARPTQAISNVCRILTDLLELREEACANADELDERKEDILYELDELDPEKEGAAERKIHLQWELEHVQHELDQVVRDLNDIDERLTEIGEETARFEKRVRSIKAGPLAAREDGSSLADDEDDFSTRVITLEGHTESVECLDFDEPWGMLVTGSADTTVRIWDLTSQHQWALLRGHTGSVNALHLVAQQLLTASADNTVRLWDISKIPTLPAHYRSSEPFYVSEEGDPEKESICTLVLEGHSASVNCVQGDGSIAVSGSSDSTIRTWDVLTGQCTGILQPGQDEAFPPLRPGHSAADISFTGWGGNGSAMGSLNNEKPRTTPRKNRKKGGQSDRGTRKQVSRKESDVLAGLEFDGDEIPETPSKLRFGTVSFMEDEADDFDLDSDVWGGFAKKEGKGSRTPTPTNKRILPKSAAELFGDESMLPPFSPGSSRDGSYVDVDGTMSLDPSGMLSSSRIPSRLPPPPVVPMDKYGHVAALQFWKHALASGHGDGVVRLWDLRQSECTRELRGHLGGITALQFDEHSVVTASSDNTLRVWDLRKGDATDEIHVEDAVSDLRFDESKIYLAGGIPQIRVYNRLSGRMQNKPGHSSPQSHKAPTRCVRYMGRMLVSGSMDGTAKVWQI